MRTDTYIYHVNYCTFLCSKNSFTYKYNLTVKTILHVPLRASHSHSPTLSGDGIATDPREGTGTAGGTNSIL